MMSDVNVTGPDIVQACLLAAVTTAARGERVEWLDTSTFFDARHAAAFHQALPTSLHVSLLCRMASKLRMPKRC